ncbi:MAG: DUF3795 domain-containing protein, partial [Eubacteriales bacterium]
CKGCANTNGCPYGKQCFVAKYILTGGMEAYQNFKKGLMDEINALDIPGMEKVSELYPLVGRFVNLPYPLPSHETVRFLRDDEMYLGAQVKNLFDDNGKACFGVIARAEFLLVCEYGENCADPEIVVYKRR